MRRGRWVWALPFAIVPAWAGAVGAAETKEVLLRGVQFSPAQVTVAAGDTVRWRYESGGDHTVTFEGGPDYHPGCPGIGTLVADCFSAGDPPVERTFGEAGEYRYFCKVHSGMAGVVAVTAEVVSTTVPPASVTTQSTVATTTTTTRPRPTTATTTRPRPTTTTTTTTAPSTTTTEPPLTTTTLTPNEAPAFDPGNPDDPADAADPGGEAASATDDGRRSGTVALIVALLLGVAGAGGALLWRLRPGR